MLPSGDDLTIILFLVGLAGTSVATGLSLLERKRKLVTRILFILTVLFGVLGGGWPWFRELSPKLTEVVTGLASNPVTWFVTIMVLATLLLSSRMGDKVHSPQLPSVSPVADRQHESVEFVQGIIIAAGMTPQTTSPVLLIADAKVSIARLRILLEYTYYSRSLNWAGWIKSRQVSLADLRDVVKGQSIKIPVATCKPDGSDVWWGGENDSAGNQIQKSRKYRAVLRFIDSSNQEQTYSFLLLRTSIHEAPYIAEVFTEKDLFPA